MVAQAATSALSVLAPLFLGALGLSVLGGRRCWLGWRYRRIVGVRRGAIAVSALRLSGLVRGSLLCAPFAVALPLLAVLLLPLGDLARRRLFGTHRRQQ